MRNISHSIRSRLNGIKCQCVSIDSVFSSASFVQSRWPFRFAEQMRRLSVLQDGFFMNDLPFSIKVSYDICDAWPGAGTGGSGVPQGDELGPLALVPHWCQQWVWQLWLSASWFRSEEEEAGREEKDDHASKKRGKWPEAKSKSQLLKNTNCHVASEFFPVFSSIYLSLSLSVCLSVCLYISSKI